LKKGVFKMISKRIRCTGCGHEGPREIMGTGPAEFQVDVFTEQGEDPYSGKLYFRCPRCGVLVAIDLVTALGTDTMNSCPSPHEIEGARLTRTRSLMSVWGADFIDSI